MSNTVNLDALLDSSLDDLADLPEFVVFPAGAHHCTAFLESKEVNDSPCIELKLKLIETKEYANPEDAAKPLAAGAESSVLFNLTNEFGQGKLKPIAKELAQHFGVIKLSEVLEAAKGGVEVMAVTKQRQNKDKTQTYLEVVQLQVI